MEIEVYTTADLYEWGLLAWHEVMQAISESVNEWLTLQ